MWQMWVFNLLFRSSLLRWATVGVAAAIAVTFLPPGFDSRPDSCGHFGRELRRVCITLNCHLVCQCTQFTVLVKSDQVRSNLIHLYALLDQQCDQLGSPRLAPRNEENVISPVWGNQPNPAPDLPPAPVSQCSQNNELLSGLVSPTKWFG